MVVDTDYLVVGAGATGLAFADALVSEADVEVTLVDRQAAPGGHWLHAYPLVRLHTPSAYYGVNSLALGEDRVDETGENTGYYERATGSEVRDYFAEAAARLVHTGQVRVLTGHEYLGGASNGEQVRDLGAGKLHDVVVRRKVVDARYLEASIPATHALPFEVAAGARLVPVNDLPVAAGSGSSYVVLGSGKTAADACVWLLDNGVDLAGFAGSGLATRGFTIAGTSSRWSRSARSSRGSPSMPRRAPRRRASRIYFTGSKLRDAWCGSTQRVQRRCTAARCSAVASSRP